MPFDSSSLFLMNFLSLSFKSYSDSSDSFHYSDYYSDSSDSCDSFDSSDSFSTQNLSMYGKIPFLNASITSCLLLYKSVAASMIVFLSIFIFDYVEHIFLFCSIMFSFQIGYFLHF